MRHILRSNTAKCEMILNPSILIDKGFNTLFVCINVHKIAVAHVGVINYVVELSWSGKASAKAVCPKLWVLLSIRLSR